MSYENWKNKAQGFQTVDVRHIQGSFFEGLKKRAEALEVGEGLHIIQTFEPHPLYAVMEGLGYEHHTEQRSEAEFHVWFCRTEKKEGDSSAPFKPLALLNYPMIDEKLGQIVVDFWETTWQSEKRVLPYETRLLLSMAVSWLFFRKDPMAQIGVAFSNAGFMGFPLVTAVLGGEAVFYAAGFVALLNALQWTYGQAKLSGDKKYIQLGAVLKNPLVLSLLGGVMIYFCRIPVPQFLRTPMGAIAGMNAPLAMIVLGVYLARTDLKAIFTRPRLYALSAVRLVVIPLLTIVCLMLLPAGWRQIGTVLIIVNAAPIGSNIAVYAQRLGLDSSYAVQMVCLSTLLSLITLPVMLSLAAALGFA